MRFPDVLIIGAMKSGTTSLYKGLTQHRRCFPAEDKEPHALCSDDVLTETGKRRYAAIYAKALPDQLCIDASTGYSKRPDFTGAANRAAEFLPAGFKVVYVVRHPIERIISQHHHDFSRGDVGADINEAVRTYPRFISYSRYNYQLEPWIDTVGWSRIKIVRFEDFVDNAADVFADLFRFLGLKEIESASTEQNVYNRTQGKPVVNEFWKLLQGSRFYRKAIRPLVPMNLRAALFKVVLPRAPGRPAAPTPETVEWLKMQLLPDIQSLHQSLELTEPMWEDFQEAVVQSAPGATPMQ